MKGLSFKWGCSVLLMGYGHKIFAQTVNCRDVLSYLLWVYSKNMVASEIAL